MTSVVEQAISVLEDTANLIQKTQINLKKCPKERLTIGYIEARIKNLEEYWLLFKNSHEKLIKNTTRDQRGLLPYFVNEEYYIHEDRFLCLLGDLKDMLAAKSQTSKTSELHSMSTNAEDSICSQVRLPRIQIPTFTGNYEDWPTFEDLFTSLVHNSALSQLQKLHYLKTSLSGEAAALLKHIQVIENNYIQAWETLKNRYGNKRLIMNSLLKRLFMQRKLNTQNASQLKSLLDTTMECIYNLQNLNIATDSWDPIIIFLVVQKLDSESHKQWEEYTYKHNSEELPSWDDLKKFLESMFRTLELVSAPSVARDKPTKERTFHVTTTTNVTTCILCKDNHSLSHCKEFAKMQPKERSNYVQYNRICFNCLAPGHKIFKCRVRLSCRICHRRHHTLLHETRNTDTSDSQDSTIQPTVSTRDVQESGVHTVIASHMSTKYNIALLATALVTVRGERGYTTVLRALIDLGSQACFISQKAAQTLRLKTIHTNHIVTGMESMRMTVTEQVNLQVLSRRDPNFCLPIQAYVMSKQLYKKIPKITAATLSEWTHITGLELADPDYYKSGPIDLLLGVKEYANILQQGLVKGQPNTPCAQETTLGWIIFGEIGTKRNMQEDMVTMYQQTITDKNRTYTKDKISCEGTYEKTCKRNEERNTKEIAKNRLKKQEIRFKERLKLKKNLLK